MELVQVQKMIKTICLFTLFLVSLAIFCTALSEPPENVSQYLEDYKNEFEDYNQESWLFIILLALFAFFIVLYKTRVKK